MPDDLVLIATKASAAIFKQRNEAGDLISEKIGDYSYTLAKTDAENIVYGSSSFASSLNFYRNVIL
jgi:hypothetical protein